jgi:hypothetical protein
VHAGGDPVEQSPEAELELSVAVGGVEGVGVADDGGVGVGGERFEEPGHGAALGRCAV